jgi:hypothetical protein
MTGVGGPEQTYDDPVEHVAREIQLYGMTGPAMMFLEASRPYRALGSQAMLFFDPVLRAIRRRWHRAAHRAARGDRRGARLRRLTA